jgi:hypothetical protein
MDEAKVQVVPHVIYRFGAWPPVVGPPPPLGVEGA